MLYAEDDENDAFFMQRAFRRLKRPETLRVVPNGREGIDYLRGAGAYADRARHPLPQLVILDVKMPELSGLEVLAWLRDRADLTSLPIVIFTSSTQASDLEVARKLRANAYIVKPSNAELLPELLGRLIAEAAANPTARFNLKENLV